MKSIFYSALLFLFGAALVSAQSIEGVWKTVDDKTGEVRSHVEIFKKSDGKYYGKVVKLVDTSNGADPVCDKCKGDRKNQKVVGLEIMRGLTLEDDGKFYGKVLDPEKGKEYTGYVESVNASKIKLRGYIAGIKALGRTQHWIK